jgi:hypothetical protein
MRILLLILTLLLLAPEAIARSLDTGAWWPAGAVITVRDYADHRLFGEMVERQTAAWAELLPGGNSVRYVREPHTPCAALPGYLKNGWNLELLPDGEILVCSTDDAPPDYYGTSGFLTEDRDADGIIMAAMVELVIDGAGPPRERRNTVCHELGHAFGAEHTRRRGSCLSSRRDRQRPGPYDAASLAASYRVSE